MENNIVNMRPSNIALKLKINSAIMLSAILFRVGAIALTIKALQLPGVYEVNPISSFEFLISPIFTVFVSLFLLVVSFVGAYIFGIALTKSKYTTIILGLILGICLFDFVHDFIVYSYLVGWFK